MPHAFTSNRPLAGVRVIAPLHVAAGSYATYPLALPCVEVTSGEKPPAGYALWNCGAGLGEGGIIAAFWRVNTSKRAAALDLAMSAARAAPWRHVPSAQTFFEALLARLAARISALVGGTPIGLSRAQWGEGALAS